jgi:hypothetical protein
MKKFFISLLLLALILPAFGQNQDEFKFSLVPRRALPQGLGPTSTPIFAGLTLSGGTASTLAYLNASKAFTSLANGSGYLLNDGSGGLSWGAVDLTGYLKKDGTTALTGAWDAGNFTIKSPSIIRSATLTIASATSKTQNADYYCDGTADEVQINQAIQALDGLGGRIVLLEGTFYINAPIAYAFADTPDNNITLEGQGAATILKVPDGHSTSMDIIDAEVSHTGNFTTMSGWTATAGWTWHDGTHWDHSAGTTALVDDTSVACVVGRTYRVIVGYTWAGASSTFTISIGGFTGTAIASAYESSVSYTFTATATTRMTITPSNGFTGAITSVTVMPALDGLVFKNFTIDNNAPNVTGTAYNGIVLWCTANTQIENVRLINGVPVGSACADGYGILIINSSSTSVSYCSFDRWEINVMEYRASDGLTVSHNIINNGTIETYSNVSRFLFSDNIMNTSTFNIGTDDTINDIDGLGIIGNIFYNTRISISNAKKIIHSGNSHYGKNGYFRLYASAVHTSIVNNLFATTGDNGVELDGTDGYISGNKFCIGANYAAGIYNGSSAAPVQWVIKNNQFIGIYLDGGVPYTIGIDLARGTNLLIQDNDFQDLNYGINLNNGVTSAQVLDNRFVNIKTANYTNGTALSASFEYGAVNRRLYKITKAFAAWKALAANSLTADMTILVMPAKTKIVAIYSDTTQTYAGTGITAATIVIGKSAGGGEYIASHDVLSAVVTKGLADADMGTEMTQAAKIQDGSVVDWANPITVTARLTTTDAHTDDLTAGSTTFYIVTERF